MGLNCGLLVVKYGIFAFNLVCVIAGIALIVAGSIPLTQIDDVRAVFPDNNPAVVPILIIVLGSLIFIISFLGCCGAIKESYCMIISYSIALSLLVVGLVALSIYIFAAAANFADTAVHGFTLLWNQMIANNDSVSRVAVEGIQRALSCCGRVSPMDWPSTSLPLTCCPMDSMTCSINQAFTNGCANMIYDSIITSGLIMASIGMFFGAILLVGIVFSCCLANGIRKNANKTV